MYSKIYLVTTDHPITNSRFPDLQNGICLVLLSDLVTLSIVTTITLYCLQIQIIALY